MAHKKRCRIAQQNAKPALKLIPVPRSSQEVVTLLGLAAHVGKPNTKLVSHLEEMAALFPKELLGAFLAFRERQACDN